MGICRLEATKFEPTPLGVVQNYQGTLASWLDEMNLPYRGREFNRAHLPGDAWAYRGSME